MVDAIKNFNSYATVAEADEYLDGSVRALSWSALDPDTKARALITATRLIDKQCLIGTKGTSLIVDSAVVAVGGAGYAVGDLLELDGGAGGEAAIVKVLTAPAGVVTTVSIVNAGYYTVAPTSPVTTIGSGTGCTLTITTEAQLLEFGRVGDDMIPEDINLGTIELAYELTLDPTLETSSTTASNIKRAKAGSAEVEFFRAGSATGAAGTSRFPAVVMEYIGEYLCSGDATILGGIASGTDGCSSFDNSDTARLNLPLS
jgi:hypothetical protein